MNELTITGGTIAYETIVGRAGMPHLVFLHEGLGCITMWGDFPERLCAATGCPGLVFDRLGYGGASAVPLPWGGDYLHRAALRDLPEILARLVPAGARFVFVGHSDGGSIALIAGAQRPEGLCGIVSIAAHVFVEDVTLAGIREARAAYEAGKLAGLRRHHGAKTDDVFRGWSQTWLDPGFAAWNIEALLASIDAPLLAVQGEDDRYGTPRQVETIVSRVQGPARAVILPACGHVPHRECPERLIPIVSAFVHECADAAGASDTVAAYAQRR
ncbi:alpha/beta hydrolase [Trinickia caryophylli]|uniref:Pimeloyl-ACP methyl ester carboxylesterase n=1 Tax=Trinickia caryophylli TaxID=28094 RepID=A0A1X7FPL3_TRICW|nr:alpha/beta hydrolase [Trinickia caryophylli]PMS09530.1 alpha/beta hydrolase [Trinickia caryophylli]TRX14431.1 alpha/beta hydrolase [Trinickia caryophylli]WQE14268.1 alpha/beta hydrolase [Trinickia caryophylli]SMF56262.1 Pimeloyl-ACP methyl ester carboxylesterase [Trinickia caryophylli]GLU33221.1 alpha/beta hydrolase [Trinickia caryophylli]